MMLPNFVCQFYMHSHFSICVSHMFLKNTVLIFTLIGFKLPYDKTIIDIYSCIRVVKILVRVLIIACQIDLLVLHQEVFSR
jgi:hypothetical protein